MLLLYIPHNFSCLFFFLMKPHPPRSTRTDTLFPYPPLFRSTTVEAGFATARRRIALRAAMTAIVIALVFGSITAVMWQGALDVAAGRLSGGSIAAFVLTGGLVAGAFGALSETRGDLLRGAGDREGAGGGKGG